MFQQSALDPGALGGNMHHRLAAKLVTACALSLAFLWSAPASAQGVEPVCNKCHEESNDSIKSTAHGAKNDANGKACQSCHGDATEHVASRGKKPVVGDKQAKANTAAQKSAACMSCHAGNRQLLVLGSRQARHERRVLLQLPQHPRQGEEPAAAAATRRRRARSRPTPAARATSRCATPR